MSRTLLSLGAAAIAALLASGMAIAQTGPMSTGAGATPPSVASKPAQSGATATRAATRSRAERAAARQKRAECRREARAQKIGVFKRRAYVKRCMARSG